MPRFWIGFTVIFSTVPAHAVNRCVDPSGAVSYQEAPCPGRGVTLKLAPTPAVDPVEVRLNNAVSRGEVSVGMSAQQVRRAWGTPEKVNRTVVGSAVREQWVYDRGEARYQYVYLANGVVTGVQSPIE